MLSQLSNSKINCLILKYAALIGRKSKPKATAKAKANPGAGAHLRVGDRVGGYIVEEPAEPGEPGEPGDPPELAEPGDFEGECKLL